MDEPEYQDLQKYYDKDIKTTINDIKNKNGIDPKSNLANKRKGFCRGGCLIRANDTWKFWWDICILLFAIFNSLVIPL